MLSNTLTIAQKHVPDKEEIEDVIKLVREKSSTLFHNQIFSLTHNGGRNFLLHIDCSDCDPFLLNTIAEKLPISHDKLVLDVDYDEACNLHKDMESIFKEYNILKSLKKNILDFCDYLQDKHQFPDNALRLSIEGNFFSLTINSQSEIYFIDLFRRTFYSRVNKNNCCRFYFDELEIMDNYIQSFVRSYHAYLHTEKENKSSNSSPDICEQQKKTGN